MEVVPLAARSVPGYKGQSPGREVDWGDIPQQHSHKGAPMGAGKQHARKQLDKGIIICYYIE